MPSELTPCYRSFWRGPQELSLQTPYQEYFTNKITQEIVNDPEYIREATKVTGLSEEVIKKTLPMINDTTGLWVDKDGKYHSLAISQRLKSKIDLIFNSSIPTPSPSSTPIPSTTESSRTTPAHSQPTTDTSFSSDHRSRTSSYTPAPISQPIDSLPMHNTQLAFDEYRNGLRDEVQARIQELENQLRARDQELRNLFLSSQNNQQAFGNTLTGYNQANLEALQQLSQNVLETSGQLAKFKEDQQQLLKIQQRQYDALEEQIQAIRGDHFEQLQRLENEHQRNLEDLWSAHQEAQAILAQKLVESTKTAEQGKQSDEAAIQSLKKQNIDSQEASRKRYEQSIAEISAIFEKDKNERIERHEKETSDLDKEKERLRKSNQELRAKVQQMKNEVEEKKDAQIGALQENYQTAIDDLRKTISDLKAQIESLKTSQDQQEDLKRNLLQKEQDLKTKQLELQKANDDRRKLQTGIKKISEQSDAELKELKEVYEKVINELSRLREDKSRLKKDLEEKEKQIQNLKEFQKSYKTEYQKLQPENEKLKREQETTQETLKQLLESHDSSAKAIDEQTEQKNKSNLEKQNLEKKLSQIQADLREKEEELTSLEKRMETTERSLKEERALVEKLEEENDRINKLNTEQQRQLTSATRKLADANRLIAELKRQLSSTTEELSQVDKINKALEEQIASLQSKLRGMQQEKQRLEDELSSVKEELEILRKELSRTKIALDSKEK
ncbi:MAG: hypothetical protein WCT85_02105, partial [Parachlamydiales bacterium]